MPELYKVGADVYVKVGRSVNPAVHQIYRALGDGQYQLSRHGTVVRNKAGTTPEIYLEEKLQTRVSSSLIAAVVVFSISGSASANTWHQSPARFTSDQTVYVKGERGVDPAPYKIHQVLDDGKYQLSKDGHLELKEDRMTPKEYSEDSLQTHQ